VEDLDSNAEFFEITAASDGLLDGIAKEIALALGGAKCAACQHALEVIPDESLGSARLRLTDVFDYLEWTLRHVAKLTRIRRTRFVLGRIIPRWADEFRLK